MALAKVQACLELGDTEFINENDRNAVAGAMTVYRPGGCGLVGNTAGGIDRDGDRPRWIREGEGNVLRAVASTALKGPLLKAELAGRDRLNSILLIGRQDTTVAQQQKYHSDSAERGVREGTFRTPAQAVAIRWRYASRQMQCRR